MNDKNTVSRISGQIFKHRTIKNKHRTIKNKYSDLVNLDSVVIFGRVPC